MAASMSNKSATISAMVAMSQKTTVMSIVPMAGMALAAHALIIAARKATTAAITAPVIIVTMATMAMAANA